MTIKLESVERSVERVGLKLKDFFKNKFSKLMENSFLGKLCVHLIKILVKISKN